MRLIFLLRPVDSEKIDKCNSCIQTTMMAHTLSRNGCNSMYRKHLGPAAPVCGYMQEHYLPHGESSRRLSWTATGCVFVFLTALGMLQHASVWAFLARSVGIPLFNIAHVRTLLEQSTLARVWLLIYPAMVSPVAYYRYCSAIEAKYDARPTKEAHQWKVQPNKFLEPAKRREEVILGCVNAAIGAFLIACLAMAYLLRGYTKIYVNTAEYGVLWFGASFIVLFFYIELWAYVSHRVWHHEWLYRYLHKVHHRYQPPTAFSAIAIHPIEFAIDVIGGQGIFWVVPIHPIVASVVCLYTAYHMIESHSGVKRTPIWPWQPTSKYHDDHHRYFHCNFGQHIMLFDQIGGTLYDASREYGQDIFRPK